MRYINNIDIQQSWFSRIDDVDKADNYELAKMPAFLTHTVVCALKGEPEDFTQADYETCRDAFGLLRDSYFRRIVNDRRGVAFEKSDDFPGALEPFYIEPFDTEVMFSANFKCEIDMPSFFPNQYETRYSQRLHLLAILDRIARDTVFTLSMAEYQKDFENAIYQHFARLSVYRYDIIATAWI